MTDRRRVRVPTDRRLDRSIDEGIVWERTEPVTPAGRPLAGAAQIAAAGIEIADRHGLYDVSVKRVANRLGVATITLDHFVPGKDDLLDLMLDAALGEITLPPGSEGEWRTRLWDLACATQLVIERHPWLRVLAGTRTPCGPHGLHVSEVALAALDGLGLAPRRRLQLANTVLAYVYGFTQLELGHERRGPDADSDATHRARAAAHLVTAVRSGDYPNLSDLFAAGHDDPDDEALSAGDAFHRGLAIVLDGVAAQLEPAGVG